LLLLAIAFGVLKKAEEESGRKVEGKQKEMKI
jgi:hypothetical protein